jgi:hypothetical protein
MNKFFLTMSILSAAVFTLPFFAQPVMAQSRTAIKDGHLPQVQWYRSRIQARVEDRTPIIKYDTPPAKEPIYIIPTALPQASAAPTVVLPGPGQGGGAGGGVNAPPGYAAIDPNNPAPARFGTNIPAHGMAPANALPNGNTTNRLAGRMWGAPKGNSGSPGAIAVPARALPAGDALAKTAVYNPIQSTGVGSGSASSVVKTSTHAELAPRGALLKK